MSSAPDVSIIIPTYNRPALLRRAVDSALAQTGAAIEIVVVDDGSDPPACVDPHPCVVVVRSENRGVSTARNVGLAQARGRYLHLLDSDDWLEPDAISCLLRAIEDHGAGIAFGSWRNVDAASGARQVIAPPRLYSDSLANAIGAGWVTGSFLMARELAARFETSLNIWEITTFLCDSLAPGVRAAACPRVVVNIAQHSEPDRVSLRYDHFEPLATARAFAAMKARLETRNLLNDDRVAALDSKLIACLHSLLRAGRPEAQEVYDAVDWARAHLQVRYRPGSFIWCARWGGLPGARSFIRLRNLLARSHSRPSELREERPQ